MPSALDLSAVPAQFAPPPSETVARQRAHVRFSVGEALAGYALGKALSVNCKDADFTDLPSLVRYLRTGPTVTVHCRVGNQRNRKHTVTFEPDGSITAHDHPGVDLHTEHVLGALAGELPICLMIAVAFPQNDPLPAWFRSGRQSLDSRLRPLYTAVAWAQDPDTDWERVRSDDTVRLGATPAAKQRWREAGFTTQQAAACWAAGASIEQARPWLATGITKGVAQQAAKGVTPAVHNEWAEYGFSVVAAAPWKRIGKSAPEAAALREVGLTATTYSQCQRHGVSVEAMRRWADSALPQGQMVSWWLTTDGDLDLALAWHAAGVPAYVAKRLISPWNTRGQRLDPMSPQEAADWLGVGVPAPVLYVVPSAVAAGVAPADFFVALHSLWLSGTVREVPHLLAVGLLNDLTAQAERR